MFAVNMSWHPRIPPNGGQRTRYGRGQGIIEYPDGLILYFLYSMLI